VRTNKGSHHFQTYIACCWILFSSMRISNWQKVKNKEDRLCICACDVQILIQSLSLKLQDVLTQTMARILKDAKVWVVTLLSWKEHQW